MRSCNILLIENSIGLSGSAISLCNLVSNLDSRLYCPTVILSRAEQEVYCRRFFPASVETRVIRCGDSLKFKPLAKRLGRSAAGTSPFLSRLFFSCLSILDLLLVLLPYICRMYSFARKRRIDLVHHNNGFDVAAIILAKLLRVPIIAYQRGGEWDSPMVRFLSKFVGQYIANSETTRNDLKRIGVDPAKIQVIFPPVDFSKYDYRLDSTKQRHEFASFDSKPCFGILGTLLEWKGHRTFLKAASHVIRTIPEARAFIVGGLPDGNVAFERELKSLANELGIADRVLFTGFRDDIPEIIQLLDVVVHTSIDPEPFGRVLIEAMAMKKPVVASNAGGPTEIIEEGKSGYLVTPGADQIYADRIILLLSDKGLARQMGEEAYSQAMSRFSISPHIEQVQKIYHKILAGGA